MESMAAYRRATASAEGSNPSPIRWIVQDVWFIQSISMTKTSNRPFTDRVNVLRGRGYRYSDLASRSGDARSSAWFNNLCNASSPWKVNPPNRDAFSGLASLLGTSEKQVI